MEGGRVPSRAPDASEDAVKGYKEKLEAYTGLEEENQQLRKACQDAQLAEKNLHGRLSLLERTLQHHREEAAAATASLAEVVQESSAGTAAIERAARQLLLSCFPLPTDVEQAIELLQPVAEAAEAGAGGAPAELKDVELRWVLELAFHNFEATQQLQSSAADSADQGAPGAQDVAGTAAAAAAAAAAASSGPVPQSAEVEQYKARIRELEAEVKRLEQVAAEAASATAAGGAAASEGSAGEQQSDQSRLLPLEPAARTSTDAGTASRGTASGSQTSGDGSEVAGAEDTSGRRSGIEQAEEVPRVPSANSLERIAAGGAAGSNNGSRGGAPGSAAQLQQQEAKLPPTGSSQSSCRFVLVRHAPAGAQSSAMTDVFWGSNKTSLKGTCPGIWGISSCKKILKFTFLARGLAAQARQDLFEELMLPGSSLAASWCQQLGCSLEQLHAAIEDSGASSRSCLEVRLDFLGSLTSAAAPVAYHTDARRDAGAADKAGERLERPVLSASEQQRFRSVIEQQGTSSMSGPTFGISGRLGSRCLAIAVQQVAARGAAEVGQEPSLQAAPWLARGSAMVTLTLGMWAAGWAAQAVALLGAPVDAAGAPSNAQAATAAAAAPANPTPAAVPVRADEAGWEPDPSKSYEENWAAAQAAEPELLSKIGGQEVVHGNLIAAPQVWAAERAARERQAAGASADSVSDEFERLCNEYHTVKGDALREKAAALNTLIYVGGMSDAVQDEAQAVQQVCAQVKAEAEAAGQAGRKAVALVTSAENVSFGTLHERPDSISSLAEQLSKMMAGQEEAAHADEADTGE
ncbi:hypothetical protein C2E21_9204 [Chlorella sorokiniana]|uniref:Uncharacterized protein n=1 Tax=Chlorella sorokiniana TaxID=3076 RepID=A0A2P6TC99_CHLSO|nr:hypothetical protein C2E21_9204 [Chlorella sorokiniana]|eukprot:PRW20264.1 hypothetical protein C2E21_9204 [Chlorella sorokiniana]